MRTIIFGLFLLACSPGSVLIGASLPYGCLSLPVLITSTNGESGSGFYLSVSNHLFLCTARHVLFEKDGKLKSGKVNLLSQPSANTNGQQTNIEIDLAVLETNKQIRFHAVHDVAIVRLAKENPKPDFGGRWQFDKQVCRVKSYSDASFVTFGWQLLGRFAEVNVGEDVYVFGYPSSIGLQASPQFDYSKPLLRKGIVSGVYQKAQTIILDSSVYFGNSGGPVMEGAGGHRIIGVVTEMIPFMDVWENKRFHYTTGNLSNSGYSVVEPIDFILDLVWD